MEADWSVELAADDPAIVVPWTTSEIGSDRVDPLRLEFLDLRHNPAALSQIAEARTEPSLRLALLTLNSSHSRLWTAKCGLWKSASQIGDTAQAAFPATCESEIVSEVDPSEIDAEPEDAVFSAGCYIDVVPLDSEASGSFAIMENWLRRLTGRLREIPMGCTRTDFVLRRSEIHGIQGLAVTWFTETCGATSQLAGLRRTEALVRVLPIVMEVALAAHRAAAK